jgi:hypothetical protein
MNLDSNSRASVEPKAKKSREGEIVPSYKSYL